MLPSEEDQVEIIADEIGSILGINADRVNLSQVPGGWLADVLLERTVESRIMPTPIEAMQDLANLLTTG